MTRNHKNWNLQFDAFYKLYEDVGSAGSVVEGIKFWKNHSNEYPLISDFTIDLLCYPATSAAQERVFSTTGITCSGCCHQLSGKQVEQEVFLKSVQKVRAVAVFCIYFCCRRAFCQV